MAPGVGSLSPVKDLEFLAPGFTLALSRLVVGTQRTESINA